MATYLGNPSLSTAVKDRVMSTFEQALQLYKVGRTEEVVQGCGLILQMDPQFDPARKLLEKARNPMAPIDIDKLVPAVGTGDALAEARDAMNRRDFQRVINITTEILTNDLMNEDARILNDSAREKMEAAPFIDQFARKFDQSMANNDAASARTNLEKARSLDPDHPAVQRMEKTVAGAAPAAPPAPAAPVPQPSGFSFDAPSFIVETPQATPGRGAAQATDFGFTFEEEKPSDGALAGFSFDTPAAKPEPPKPAPAPAPAAAPEPAGFSFDAPSGGGFSFDSPAPAAPPPPPVAAPSAAPAAPPVASSADFDFSSASFETSDDDRRKIDQYLSDGDRAYDAGDFQQAIDLWSRIFLIDVTNEPASDRIEKAKAKRRETDQKVEPLITAGVAAFDRRDFDGAREKFNEALRVDPTNASAHDYLERLSNAVEEGGAAATVTDYVPPTAGKRDIFADEDLGGTYEVPVTTPPPKPADEKKPAAKAAPVKTSRRSPMGAVIAIVAVAVLAGAGWFAYSKFLSKPAYDPTATKRIFADAATLSQQGKYDLAIAKLQDVKPEDPQHDAAVVMIADLQHKKSQAAEMIDGKPAAQYFSDQVNAGRAAYDAHDYDGAKRAFEQAMRVKPLPSDVKPLYDTSAQQVAKLDAAKSLFKEHRFADALGNLQQLSTQDPQNKNITRMVIDAHFNLGAAALQEERLPDAMKEFDEVLKLDPNDELAKRSKELAVRYNGQPKDLLYKIYVKYLPMRQVA
ncbi:MAG TPA: tetratricopeptide repeat protein [Thermoanaerobaculia bacterium]|jgi:tetratricopeptide (TPR) repeat protein|nr:tetratricopeptide repeat protein [Thermoanaerobaculia bacterium]